MKVNDKGHSKLEIALELLQHCLPDPPAHPATVTYIFEALLREVDRLLPNHENVTEMLPQITVEEGSNN